MEIELTNISYSYEKDSPFEKEALRNISLSIKSGTYTAIVGHTGSGKSTLLQHLNGLLLPTSGKLNIGEVTIDSKTKKKHLKDLKRNVGYVFQNPEHQLFEETVEKEVLFGLLNFGYSKERALIKAHEALQLTGIDKNLYQRSPLELSGGQMRRVAIASIIAVEPKVLILDEPAAGLDFSGRKKIMDLFTTLHKEKNITIILVTHQMEDVAAYAEHVFVMKHGELIGQGTPQEVFYNEAILEQAQLDVPETVLFMKHFDEKFQLNTRYNSLSIESAVNYITHALKDKE
jgi:energy-coupling factor transport system ATP-binding protein